jgi:hypothetical protein
MVRNDNLQVARNSSGSRSRSRGIAVAARMSGVTCVYACWISRSKVATSRAVRVVVSRWLPM